MLQIVSVFLFALHTYAASDSVQYIHYDITNGLPSNNVYSTIQDHNGYIWFATDKGAVRFNGYNFKVFNSSTGLPADDVYRLQEDSKGRIWIWTLAAGFGYLQGDIYHGLHFPFRAEGPLHPSWVVECKGYTMFTYNRQDSRALAVADTDIVCTVSGQVLTNSVDQGAVILLTTDTIYSFAYSAGSATRTGSDFFVTDLSRLPLISRRAGKVPADFIQLFLISAAATDNSILSIVNREHIAFFHFRNNVYKVFNINDYFVKGEILKICSIFPQSILIFTNYGTYVMDYNYRLISREMYDKSIFGNISLCYKMSDSFGNTWYSSGLGGAWMITGTRLPVKHKNSLFADMRKLGVAEGVFSYWYNEKAGKIYQMSATGNYRIWNTNADKKMGKIQGINQWDDHTVEIQGNDGHSFLDANTGRQLPDLKKVRARIGINVEKGRSGINDMHFLNGVLSAIKVGPGRILEANSIWLYSASFYNDSAVYKKQSYLRVQDIVKLPATDRYLCYNNENVFVYNTTIDTGFLFSPGVYSNQLKQINSISADSNGNIFILTGKDLLLYNFYHRTLSTINHYFSLDNAKLEVQGNNLVLAGNFGVAIAAINKDGSTGNFHCLENIGNDHYLQVTDTWLPGNGRIFFNTDKGLLQTTISDVRQYGREYSTQNTPFSIVAAYPFNRPVHSGDTLLLDHKNGRLSFDAINFYGSGAVQYQYRIKELQNNWQETKAGEILLDAVTPEKYYTLQVQVNDKAWQSGVINIVLYRPPYWYQTQTWKTIGWICMGILILLSGFGAVSIARYAARRAQEKKQLMTDLELRAIHSQINPHFIFNTLSTALYFISRKEYDNAYGHVNKFSHLLRSYLKSSHDRYVILAEEIDMLKRYIELQQERFEQRFTYEITVDNKLPAGNIQIPSLLLQPLVENAINHGLFHKKEPGRLKIRFEQGSDNTELVCTIEDNGVGREQARLIKQQSAVRKESFGTKLTDKLVKIFRQYEEMDISIDYTDKQLPETGTIVQLAIKNVKYVV